MKLPFLTAEWKNLVMINYSVSPEILIPYLPKGTSLDLYQNKCYVSVVGFLFQNTKVLGVKIPYHINFEEVNLRFYVKFQENDTWKRGVVFIKEIVPKPAITFIANALFKENYVTTKMNHNIISNKFNTVISYKWQTHKLWQEISVTTNLTSHIPSPNSLESFITEHYYGYTKDAFKTYEYEVQHPSWELFKVLDYEINIDFGLNYGAHFRILNRIKPSSLFVAKGSKINVLNKRCIQ